MNVLPTIGVLILMLQFSCIVKTQSLPAANARPTVRQTAPNTKEPTSAQSAADDFRMATLQAQELLRLGITFGIWEKVEGRRTDEIPVWTGDTYISFDGIEINTSIGLYKTSKLATSKYQAVILRAKEILKQNPMLNDKNRELGERVIASTESGYLIGIRKGQSFNLYESSSLAHLIAFEKWRDRKQQR